MKKENHAIVITGIVSGVVLVIALVAIFALVPAGSSGQDVVTVQGISTVKAMPDLITVYFNVETEGETTAEARDANSEIMNKLIDALVAEGFDRKEIITENFNVYQNYEWTENERIDNGFIATHSVRVELSIEEEDKIASVVDAGVDAGAMINYINFELTQESQNKYKAEAMKLAAEDAKVKADSVAEGFGKTAGKLVSVQVNDFGYYPWNVYSRGYETMDSVAVKESVSNIQVGEEEVTASISASFKLR